METSSDDKRFRSNLSSPTRLEGMETFFGIAFLLQSGSLRPALRGWKLAIGAKPLGFWGGSPTRLEGMETNTLATHWR